MRGTSAEVADTRARDPAYRPTGETFSRSFLSLVLYLCIGSVVLD